MRTTSNAAAGVVGVAAGALVVVVSGAVEELGAAMCPLVRTLLRKRTHGARRALGYRLARVLLVAAVWTTRGTTQPGLVYL